jgi:hypothetical protein
MTAARPYAAKGVSGAFIPEPWRYDVGNIPARSILKGMSIEQAALGGAARSGAIY